MRRAQAALDGPVEKGAVKNDSAAAPALAGPVPASPEEISLGPAGPRELPLVDAAALDSAKRASSADPVAEPLGPTAFEFPGFRHAPQARLSDAHGSGAVSDHVLPLGSPAVRPNGSADGAPSPAARPDAHVASPLRTSESGVAPSGALSPELVVRAPQRSQNCALARPLSFHDRSALPPRSVNGSFTASISDAAQLPAGSLSRNPSFPERGLPRSASVAGERRESRDSGDLATAGQRLRRMDTRFSEVRRLFHEAIEAGLLSERQRA